MRKRDIVKQLAAMSHGDRLDIGAVCVQCELERSHGLPKRTWWTQAGGGCEFSRSPERAAAKIMRLLRHEREG